MRLADLLDGVEYSSDSLDDRVLETVVADLQVDSRKVGRGSVFLAMATDAAQRDRHVAQAVAAGATVVVTDTDISLPDGVVSVRTPDVRRAAGPISSNFFDHPSRALSVVAVTGTNGKSSVTHLVASILRARGISVGTVGTGRLTLNGEPLDVERTTPTTPEAYDLQRSLPRFGD